MEVKRVDTYVYKLVRNGQTVYIGITNDLARREQEHCEDKQFDKMQVIKGPCTREEAEISESNQLDIFTIFHNGRLPEYNQTCNGK